MNSYLFIALYSVSWAATLRILQFVLPTCIACYYSTAAVCLLTSIIAYFFYPIIKRLYYDERVLPHNKAVFITGCDTGFGHELAKRLDSKGFTVFASCLFPDGEGAKRLKEACSSGLHILGLDVSKDDSVRDAVEYVKKNIGKAEFWALVNNAGVLRGFDVALSKIESFQESLNINTLGVVRTTKAFLPLLFKSRGRVVVVTSLASRTALPHMAAYTMSKYASRAFCETFRQEMHPWGIRVIEIEPEAFSTPIADPRALFAEYENCLSGLDEDIKADYGERYFEEFKKSLKKGIDRVYSKRIYRVVDDLEDATTLLEPCDVYVSCRNTFSQVFMFGSKIMPRFVNDTVVRVSMYLRNFPVPRGVENNL